MSTTVMSLKTDKKLKEQAHRLAETLGFQLGTLLNAFMRDFVRKKEVHFDLEPTYKMSKALEKELEKVEKDIKMGKNISPAFDDVEEAIKYLHEHKG